MSTAVKNNTSRITNDDYNANAMNQEKLNKIPQEHQDDMKKNSNCIEIMIKEKGKEIKRLAN